MNRTAVAAPAQPPDADVILEQVASLSLGELTRLKIGLQQLLERKRREERQSRSRKTTSS